MSQKAKIYKTNVALRNSRGKVVWNCRWQSCGHCGQGTLVTIHAQGFTCQVCNRWTSLISGGKERG
jgi:hypothetical protein